MCVEREMVCVQIDFWFDQRYLMEHQVDRQLLEKAFLLKYPFLICRNWLSPLCTPEN